MLNSKESLNFIRTLYVFFAYLHILHVKNMYFLIIITSIVILFSTPPTFLLLLKKIIMLLKIGYTCS